MEIKSRTVKVWDIHAFCVVCGDHLVISLVNDPQKFPDFGKMIRKLIPVCEHHRVLLPHEDQDVDGAIWQTFEQYEEFVRATHE